MLCVLRIDAQINIQRYDKKIEGDILNTILPYVVNPW